MNMNTQVEMLPSARRRKTPADRDALERFANDVRGIMAVHVAEIATLQLRYSAQKPPTDQRDVLVAFSEEAARMLMRHKRNLSALQREYPTLRGNYHE